MTRKILLKFAPILICPFLVSFLFCSCKEKRNPETLLVDTMEEVNKAGNGYDDFKIYNNDSYYAIVYQLKNTPENKAKILWLGNHENLGNKFRTELLKRLKKGDILETIVKEKKALVLAVSADEIEYHAVFSSEEIAEEVFKN